MGRYKKTDKSDYIPIASEFEEKIGMRVYEYETEDLETGEKAVGYGMTRQEAKEDSFRRLKSGEGKSLSREFDRPSQDSPDSFFDWGAEKKEKKKPKETSRSYGSSWSESYDREDRSWKGIEEDSFEKAFAWGCGIVFAIGLLGLGLGIAGGIRSELKEERQKKLMQETHRIERYEPLHELPEETLALTEDSRDFSLSPDGTKIVYSKKVEYSKKMFGSEMIKERGRIFLRGTYAGLEEMIGVQEADLSLLGPGSDLMKKLSWEDLVAPMYSPDGKKIAFAVTRRDHGTGVYLMDDKGDDIRAIFPHQNMGAGSVAYGWIDNDVLFLWKNSYSDNGLSNYEDFRRGKMSLINTSIDERVRLNELPKIDFPLRHVSHGIVKKYIVEDGVEGNQVNLESGRKLWEKLWVKEQNKWKSMPPEFQIKRGVTKWMDKQQGIIREDDSHFPVYEFNDYEIVGKHTWVALTVPHWHPLASKSYLFYNFDDKKNWEVKWEGSSYDSVPIELKFLDENEGYLATMESIYHSVNGGDSWDILFRTNTLFGEGIENFFVYDKDHLRVSFCTEESYDSYDGGKTWE